jgi:hypothetical protein
VEEYSRRKKENDEVEKNKEGRRKRWTVRTRREVGGKWKGNNDENEEAKKRTRIQGKAEVEE